MKCPKCGYLGFDSGDRCKNCGYDFSLALSEMPPPHLPIRQTESMGPFRDLDLKDPQVTERRSKPDTDAQQPEPASRRTPGAPDLPLFEEDDKSSDEPLPISTATPPRPPLAVRRSSPPIGRTRPRAERVPQSDVGLGLAAARFEEPEPPPAMVSGSGERVEAASAGRRVVAAAIDLLLLGAVDLAIIYLTIRICRISIFEIGMVPKAPLAGFLAFLNGGYLVAFTAAIGQTIGNMAMGIKVVRMDGGRVEFGRAVLRTVACFASALPLGLGFVPGLVGETRRALHDRLAETRVVNIRS